MGRTLLSYAYDLDGNKISRRDVTGKETAYTYSRDGMLTAVLEGGKTLAAYTYHADGNVERLCIGETLSTTYGYDMDRNLQSIRTMDGTTVLTDSTFSYDGNANRTQKKGLEGLTRYSYDANNRLIEVQYPHIIGSLKDGNTSFEKLSYDKQGNMLSDGSNTYSYDGFNCVAEVRTKYEECCLEEVIGNDRQDDIIPNNMIPIANDRGGNYYYWDMSSGGIYLFYCDDIDNPIYICRSIEELFEIMNLSCI